MRAQTQSVFPENLDVLKNLDFWTRNLNAKSVLFSSDYFGEGHYETALELAILMQEVYRKSVVMVDLRVDGPDQDAPREIQYQNVRDLNWLSKGKAVNYRKLDEHLKALAEQNSVVFVIQDIKRIPTNTSLPEVDIDAAVLVRSPRSIGPGKKRFVTDMIKDANLPILGLIYNRV